MRILNAIAPLLTLLLLAGLARPLGAEDKPISGVLDAILLSLDGKPYAMAQLRGQVIMLVNVASRCGNTPQYAGLEALYEKYKDAGLVIIGIPADNFGHQEPGSNEEIRQFCTATYHVTFPMMAKVSVKGDDIDPLYQYLTVRSPQPGEIAWNFAKFLVNRHGEVIARFNPKTKPEDPALVAAVEKALAEDAKDAKDNKDK